MSDNPYQPPQSLDLPPSDGQVLQPWGDKELREALAALDAEIEQRGAQRWFERLWQRWWPSLLLFGGYGVEASVLGFTWPTLASGVIVAVLGVHLQRRRYATLPTNVYPALRAYFALRATGRVQARAALLCPSARPAQTDTRPLEAELSNLHHLALPPWPFCRLAQLRIFFACREGMEGMHKRLWRATCEFPLEFYSLRRLASALGLLVSALGLAALAQRSGHFELLWLTLLALGTGLFALYRPSRTLLAHGSKYILKGDDGHLYFLFDAVADPPRRLPNGSLQDNHLRAGPALLP